MKSSDEIQLKILRALDGSSEIWMRFDDAGEEVKFNLYLLEDRGYVVCGGCATKEGKFYLNPQYRITWAGLQCLKALDPCPVSEYYKPTGNELNVNDFLKFLGSD